MNRLAWDNTEYPGVRAEGVGKEPAVQQWPVSPCHASQEEQVKGAEGQTNSGPDGRVAVELQQWGKADR